MINRYIVDINLSKLWVHIIKLHHFDSTAVLYWEWMCAFRCHFSRTWPNCAMIITWFNSPSREVPESCKKQRDSECCPRVEIAKMHFFSGLQVQLQPEDRRWSIELRKWKSNYYWSSLTNEVKYNSAWGPRYSGPKLTATEARGLLTSGFWCKLWEGI